MKIADGEFYATTEELWDWKQENWSQALAQLRRAEPPKVYSDLAQAIHASETSDLIPGDSLSAQTSLVSCVKVLNDADFSIFGNPACKGHQIPKSETCRPFYGPVAEIATGLDLSNDDDRQKKWRRLLWGGTKPTDGHGFVGLEKRAENFVVINNPHRGIYDTLEDGVLATIPICYEKFSSEWQQGRDYDLLVVANSARTYHVVNMNTGSCSTRFHREASIEDIRKATNFLGICIKALAQILASESNMLLGPMEEVLNKNYDGKRQKEIEHCGQMRSKLDALEELRTYLLLKDGAVDVPTINANGGKAVLKIDMKEYMQNSGVTRLPSGDYPYPDPWLVGMKAAINVYFGHTKVKLHPACPPPHDKDSDDKDCWYLDAVHGSSPCVTGAAQYSLIQEEYFSFPQDISIVVSDNDDDILVITDDGEYCALLTTGKQSVACIPNQKRQGRYVTP